MSVEFEPVKLAQRRRRTDPVLLGVLVVMLALGTAVLKPWDHPVGSASSPEPGLVGPGPSGSPDGTQVTPASVLPRILATTATFASPDKVRTALRPHDAWGVRAIVAEPSATAAVSGQRFAEIWDELPTDPSKTPTVDIEPNDRTVVAIGLTFPAAHTPLDARIWLVRRNELEWIDTKAIDASPTGGAFLYRVANVDGSVRNWPAGRYRVDVLVDGAIRRFGFTLPNRFEIVPTDPAPEAVPTDLVDPAATDVSGLPLGPLLTAQGVAVPLAGVPGPALSEAGAWLDVDPGTRRAPRAFVATAFQPSATGLGVILPLGSVVRASSVRRLAPEPLPGEPQLPVDVFDPGHPNRLVLYRARGGGAWTAGVYRLDIAWTDGTGVHDLSWTIELRPGPLRESPPILTAARAYARYAGGSGIVVGTTEPLEGGPRDTVIRLLREPTPPTGSVLLRDRIPCSGSTVEHLASVVGLAHPRTSRPFRISARAMFEYKLSDELPVLVAAGDVPGLTLIAPNGNAGATSDVYRARLADSRDTTNGPLCVRLIPEE